MAQKVAVLVVLCFACAGVGYSEGHGWWNPIQWRDYWKIWWKDAGQPKPGRSGALLSSAAGPNVCSHKIPAGTTRLCRKVDGAPRLRCRTEQLYTYEYRCCPGFTTDEGREGCPLELFTSGWNLTEVATSLGLTQFVKFLQLSGLESELGAPGMRFTFFAPSNEALRTLDREILTRLVGDRKKLQKFLLFHVASGKLVSSGFHNDQLVKTLSSPHKLRINVDGEQDFVQGARVTSHDQGVHNGVLHVVSRVLFPPSGDLKDVLKSNAEISIFSKMLRTSNISVANVTVFAPTDEAFNSLPRDRLDKLLGNHKCLERFLKNHLLSKPMYASVMANRRLPTLEGSLVDFRANEDGSFVVNDANVIRSDVSATDGVVHVIDKVLMPLSAMDLIEVAQILNLTRLVEMIGQTDMSTTLQDGGPFTLFAPTNDAFESWDDADPAKLGQTLRYHVASGNQWTYMFRPNTRVPSLDGKNDLFLNSYRFGKVFSVDSACIVRANVQAGNGVIHVIPKVLVPAQKTIYGLISADPRFSTLQKLVNATSLRDELRNENASFTLFAPTDAAFEQLLDRSVLDSIGEFPDEVLGMLKDHVVRNALYTCGIHCKYSYWSLFSNRFSVFSLSRGVLRLQYRWNGHVLVNGIRLSQPDISATNGVVHVIDRVLQPNQLGARRKALQ